MTTFTQLRDSGKCCLAHITATDEDALGLRFVLLSCQGCKDKDYCLSLKNVLAQELNRRSEVARILRSNKNVEASLWDKLELDRRLGK